MCAASLSLKAADAYYRQPFLFAIEPDGGDGSIEIALIVWLILTIAAAGFRLII